MTRLLVDAGNSRVKWAFSDGASVGAVSALEYAGSPTLTVDALLANVGEASEIALVDVTGRLHEPLAARWRVRALHATAAACDVRNGYTNPAALGADRWAALIGARHCVAGACCVVDAGTALTVDVLAADGSHLGGWIAPGFGLARDALLRGTQGVRPSVAMDDGNDIGRDTTAAVAGGVALAALGFVDRATRVASRALDCEPVLVITGGDAARVVAALPGARHIDDLVMRGLAIWAEA